MRQQFPGTSAEDCVEDAVQEFPSAVYGRAAARFYHRDERFQVPIRGRSGQYRTVRGTSSVLISTREPPFQTPSDITTLTFPLTDDQSGSIIDCVFAAIG
jgi:hypothetical protein